MLGILLVAVIFVLAGVISWNLPRSHRWVADVVASQNRLPSLLRGSRRPRTERQVVRGAHAAAAFSFTVGMAALAWAIYVGVRGK